MTTATRASLDEVKDFANKVREAGGGNPLDALMPAVPSDSTQCLIARNLNFNCTVNKPDSQGPWMMFVEEEDIARKISEALDLELIYHAKDAYSYQADPDWSLVLPDRIGKVASDFDKAWAIAETAANAKANWDRMDLEDRDAYEDWTDYARSAYTDYLSSDWDTTFDLALVEEMWPYIEESVKEADTIGIFNDKGELIL